jgi:hypothetical protein
MPLTQAQGRLLANDQLKPRLYENRPIRVPAKDFLPVAKINGFEFRVANIAAEQPLADVLPEGGTVPEQTQVPVNISFPLGLMATEVAVNDKTQYTLSDVNNQALVQVERGVDRLWYKANQLLITGVLANAGEFLGWRDPSFTTPTQTIDATAGFTLGMLDRVQGLIRVNQGFGNFMYMPRKIYDQVRALCYTSGFLPQHEPFPVPDGSGGVRLQSIMHWNGWPMFFCDDAVFPDIVAGPSRFSEIYVGVAGPEGVGWLSPSSIGNQLTLVETVLQQANGRKVWRMWLPLATYRCSETAIARITNIPLPP